MDSKKVLGLIVGAVVLAGCSFYGGMLYGKKSATPTLGAGGFPRDAMAGQRQFGGTGQNRTGAGARFGGAGFTAGEVLSTDENSMTVKMADGGSRIVFFASSTTIGKMSEGSKDDLAAGTSVVVNGASNSDGSVTATTIQIRPAGEALPVMRPAAQ